MATKNAAFRNTDQVRAAGVADAVFDVAAVRILQGAAIVAK
jgi:hypothetical protein